MSFGKSGGTSKSNSESRQLTPGEVQGYYNRINANTGGRLNRYAQEGTPEVQYDGLTADELRALGGLGATREQKAGDARSLALGDIEADAGLDVAQRTRARQLVDDDYKSSLDAIAKESEAALTGLSSEESARQYQAALNNANLTREDLEAIAGIYFGGKGQNSASKSRSYNFGVSGGL